MRPVAISLVAGAGWLAALTDVPTTYVFLGASAIVLEELAPIFGGIAAHEGELQLMRVLVAISLGGWIATLLLYLVGRTKWDVIRKRFPRVRATGTVALRVVGRNPLLASFLVRFAFGLRVVLPMVCGAARVSPWVFVPGALLGSISWTVLFTAIGFAAGEAAVQAMGHIGRVGEAAGAVLLTVVILALVRWDRGRRARKHARRTAGKPTT